MGKFEPPNRLGSGEPAYQCRAEKVRQTADRLVERGKVSEAIAQYAVYLDRCGFDWQIQNRLGDLYARIGDIPAAVLAYQSVVRFWDAGHQDDASEANRLSYARYHSTSSAVAMLKKILRLEPSNMEVQADLARLNASQGLKADAFRQWAAIADCLSTTAKSTATAYCRRRAANLMDVATPEPLVETCGREAFRAALASPSCPVTDYYISSGMFAEARGLKSEAAEHWMTVASEFERIGNVYFAAEYRLRARLAQAHDDRSVAKQMLSAIPEVPISDRASAPVADGTDSFTATSATDMFLSGDATDQLTASDPMLGTRSSAVAPQHGLRVFLSYASEDRAVARLLSARLGTEGFLPWFDQNDLLPGQNWEQEIVSAVIRSHVVLICVSRTSASKVGFLQKEIRIALDALSRQPDGVIFVIPVRFESCSLPLNLQHLHAVDLHAECGFDVLIRALHTRAAQLHPVG